MKSFENISWYFDGINKYFLYKEHTINTSKTECGTDTYYVRYQNETSFNVLGTFYSFEKACEFIDKLVKNI